ncbi:hypothetical protein LSTR_LSTR005291 [Laodelphax striatellus]|uniref:EIPR1-like beta-propeller domain-containing protein n=1 Tax=Laodelphax striatellus TaxID=195883 RepID=A0A482X7F3_LAOST|nr:hypothetical protein LSTR_LSTR005291 [Laodelphax striatellus]
MDEDKPSLYGLEFPARSLAAQIAETEVVRFLVGTQSLKFANNQIHLVEFDEKNGTLNSKVYQHDVGEVWSLTSSPKDPNVLSTCYNTLRQEDNDCVMKSALWRMPEASPGDASTPLEQLCLFDTAQYGTQVKVTAFHPTETEQAATVVDNNVLIWDVGEATPRLTYKVAFEGKGHPRFTTGKWNHQQVSSQFATANDSTIRGWDLRTSKQAWAIENAHSQLVRDLDFNPNRLFFVGTCGDDASCKFWDLRQTAAPVVTMAKHSHWVWVVRYNQVRDQLVLSASSDGVLLLSSVASIASAPLEEDDGDGDEAKRMPDGVLATHDQHEDSVYCVEWSAANPWCFASLSYDGRLLINKVARSIMIMYL